ncbi:MAG TPA: hypothetical protein VH333_15555 [Pseudonocardiaceae bacterium]|nr:hypothetical protein [Pseudonocardiaceae bacterium]
MDRNANDDAVFRRAVALGPELNDPQTDDTWLPVLRQDRVIALVDPTVVVDVSPTHADIGVDLAAEVVEMPRHALNTAVDGVAEDGDADDVQILLADFVTAVSPVQRTLEVLADIEPTGLLATAIIYLVRASIRLDIGDVVAARAAIEAAYVAFQNLSSDPD